MPNTCLHDLQANYVSEAKQYAELLGKHGHQTATLQSTTAALQQTQDKLQTTQTALQVRLLCCFLCHCTRALVCIRNSSLMKSRLLSSITGTLFRSFLMCIHDNELYFFSCTAGRLPVHFFCLQCIASSSGSSIIHGLISFNS